MTARNDLITALQHQITSLEATLAKAVELSNDAEIATTVMAVQFGEMSSQVAVFVNLKREATLHIKEVTDTLKRTNDMLSGLQETGQ